MKTSETNNTGFFEMSQNITFPGTENAQEILLPMKHELVCKVREL